MKLFFVFRFSFIVQRCISDIWHLPFNVGRKNAQTHHSPFTIHLLTIAFCLLPVSSAFAQWNEVPLLSRPPVPAEKKINIKSNSQKITARSLPFFDDFSLPIAGKPDTNLWFPNGGVRVDNQVNPAFQPPSKGVAHFDGLNFKGVPYSQQLQLSQGRTDTLTSKSINLAGLQTADNLYLSFFYQAKGLGEVPDVSDGDSLLLEFKDASGNWKKRWDIAGEALAAFKQIFVAVNSPEFFHGEFQFRFRTVGRQSGAYDTWVLDYVYLNKNRTTNDWFFRDLSPTLQPTSLLRRYTSMPYFEFFKNKTQHLADTVFTFLNNNNNVFNFPGWTINLKNARTNQIFETVNVPSQRIEANERRKIIYRPNPASIPNLTDSLILKTEFNFITGDNNTVIPGVDFRQNDTISRLTYLGNEFAYDDGIADYAGGINQRLGRVAIQYNVSQRCKMTGVKFYLPQIGRSLVGQTFVLSVWRDNASKPGAVIFQKSIAIDSASFNRFNLYSLEGKDEFVIVDSVFYVGWQQVSTVEQLNVGIDKSRDAGQYLFFNLGGNDWTANRDAAIPLEGSFMVRPVLKPFDLTPVEPEPQFADFQVFPNPAQDVLNWTAPNVQSVQVYNLLGQLVFSKSKPTENQISVSALENGLYLVHFQIGKSVVSRKVVISR